MNAKIRSSSVVTAYTGLMILMLAYVVLSLPHRAWAVATHSTSKEERLTFNLDRQLDATGLVKERKGGKVLREGIPGATLRLNRGEYLVIDSRRAINPRGGAISFWVRPQWSPADRESHTFVSFPWKGSRSGYFAISRGWWEPAGQGLTYFIANNVEHANLARQIRYDQKGWTHIVCVWSHGAPGFTRLYVNGLRVGEDRRYAADDQAGAELYLGVDKGTPLAAGRWANADFTGVSFFRVPLNDQEVLALYQRDDLAGRLTKPAASRGNRPVRAIFDEGTGWMTDHGAKQTIRRIKEAGFNVLVPCVWHGGGTRYPTDLAPSEDRSISLGTDPLRRLIEIAHENNIEVHPWFTITLREKDFLTDLFGAGSPPKAFDIHRPEFRRFIVGLIADVARRYKVDGINLDYIRTMGICMCTDCTTEYRTRTGRNLASDASSAKPGVPLGKHLQSWQDDAVELLVREVSRSVKSLRPEAVISIDGNPQSSVNREGRQESRWTNAGLVDVVYNMDYADPPDAERHYGAQTSFAEPWRLIPLISNHEWDGRRVTPKPAERLRQNIDYLLRRWPEGIGVYLYSMLDDEQVRMLAAGPFGMTDKRDTGNSVGRESSP